MAQPPGIPQSVALVQIQMKLNSFTFILKKMFSDEVRAGN